MSVLSRGAPGPTKINQVQINQSALGYAVPVVMGRGKIQQSLLWSDGFSAKKVNTSSGGGKGIGGGKGGTQYVYSADVIAALCCGPIGGIGDVWSNQSWLSNTNTAETWTITGGTPIYTPINATAMTADAGVSTTTTYSGSFNDAGSSSPTTLSGSDFVPFRRVAYGTTLASGQYSINPANNNYYFAAADAGKTVTLSYNFSLSVIKQQEIDLIPSGKTISVGGSLPFSADGGVIYYTGPSAGTALTKVSGTPTVTGTYSVSGSGPATYKFAPGDIGAEVLITFKLNNSSAIPTGTPTSLAFTEFAGTIGQTPWATLSSAFPGASLGYSGIAYAAYGPMNLGYGAQIQQNVFEVFTTDQYGGGIADCSPVQCLLQVLTNSMWGLGAGAVQFPTNVIDNGASGTWGNAATGGTSRKSDSTAWSWFAANGFFISPVLDRQDTAASVMSRWLEAGQCAAFMSEGLMKLVPYGDTSMAGNGATWVAPQSFVAALDDTCFLAHQEGEDPVKIAMPTDNFAQWNVVQVQWNNRSNQYAPEVTPEWDQGARNRFGDIIEDPQTWDFITTLPSATFAASMRVKRSVYIRNTYEFQLPYSYSYLEPMDLVKITTSSLWAANINNANLGVNTLPVRITKIVDNPTAEGLQITAEDYPFGTNNPTIFNKSIAAGTPQPDTFADPGASEVVMFEPPARLTDGYKGNQIWIGATGANDDWGSCNIWVSKDGTNYDQVGTIETQACLGALDQTLSAGNDFTISTNGGSTSYKFYVTAVGTSVNGQNYYITVRVNNTGSKPVIVDFNSLAPNQTVAPGTVANISAIAVGNGVAGVQLLFDAQNVGDSLSFHVGTPSVSTTPGGANLLTTAEQAYGTGWIQAPGATVTVSGPESDPDYINPLIVDLVENSRSLSAGSTTDADNGTTACFVDGEILSYSTVVSSGQDQYTMGTYLRRGQYNTPQIGSHAAGGLFLRLDAAVYKFTYDPTWAGKTLFFKFQSVNSFGNSAQPLSSLTAVAFTIPGKNPGSIDASSGLLINPSQFAVGAGPIGWSPAATGTAGPVLVVDTANNYPALSPNLLSSPQDFENWGAGGAIVAVDSTTAPDGTNTADKLTGNNAGSDSRYQTFTASADTYTFTVYVRAGTTATAALGIFDITSSAYAIASARILSGPGSVSVSGPALLSGLTSAWTRVEITSTTLVPGHSCEVVVFPDGTGANTQSNYCWGAQLTRVGVIDYVPSPNPPASVNLTNFYARFTGYLVPSVTGLHTIGVNSDDGCNLYVAGKPIVLNLTTNQAANSSSSYRQSGQLLLTAGVYYPIVLEWQQNSGGFACQLLWTPPGSSVQPIPQANLSTSLSTITGNLNVSWWNGTPGLWYPSGNGSVDATNPLLPTFSPPENAGQGVSVVTSVTNIGATGFTAPVSTGQNAVVPGWFSANIYLTTIDEGIMLLCGSNHAYMFLFTGSTSGGDGHMAQILRVDSISGSSFAHIETHYQSALSANFTGWVTVDCYYGNGYMAVWVNGTKHADALDNTYLPANSSNLAYFGLTSGGIIGPSTSQPGSTSLNPQGSIPPSEPIQVPSYTKTTTSITFSSSSQSVTLADGSVVTVTFAGATFSGLSASTTYFFYAYVRTSDYTIQFANGSPPPTAANAADAIAAAGDGRIALTPFSVSTPASGSGSGGGGYSCPESEELVEVQRQGQTLTLVAKDVQIGDLIKGHSFKTNADVYRRVVSIRTAPCLAWRIVRGHKVSPCEPVWDGTNWTPAYKVPDAVFDGSAGIKVSLYVQADEDGEHNFWLTSETPQLVHNWIPIIGSGGC